MVHRIHHPLGKDSFGERIGLRHCPPRRILSLQITTRMKWKPVHFFGKLYEQPSFSLLNNILLMNILLCSWSRDRACHEYNAREGCIKYLALSSSHSPFWFVQLMNFDLIFNNVKAGLLAASISTNIPTTYAQPTLNNCVVGVIFT